MDKEIEIYNRRLAAGLGSLHGKPWFQWVWAPDQEYFLRAPGHQHESYTRFSWGDRIGKVWVLAEWGPPPMTREAWSASLGGQFPYPEHGRSIVHPETALPPGQRPDADVTQFYIARIDQQASTSYENALRAINAGIEAEDNAVRREFMDYADDWFPAYWSSKGGAHTPGARGGHVSFGGA